MALYSQRAYQLLGRSYTRGFTITIRRSTFSYLLGLLKVLTLLQVGLLRASEKGGRGLTRKDKPEYKRVVITIPNTINWRFNKVSVSVLTHKGWVEIPLRITKQFTHYLYDGWRVSQELKLRLVGRKALVWLGFEKEVEVETEEGNYISMDVNENNVTLAVFEGFKLKELRRYETGLGRIVLNYSLRREEITKGYSTKGRVNKEEVEETEGKGEEA